MFRVLKDGTILAFSDKEGVQGDQLTRLPMYDGTTAVMMLSVTGQQYALAMGAERFVDVFIKAGGEVKYE